MWEIKWLDIEASNYCNAACPMCARSYAGVINPNLKLNHLDPNAIWKLAPYLKEMTNVSFCGNYGDPIANLRLLEIIEVLHSIKQTPIMIHTNGGARNKEFWQDLAKIPMLKVRFGIDGLEDTNHLYRKNVRWDVLENNFKTYIDAGGHAQWKMILFKHNYHQLEEAQKRAKEYGFKKFMYVKTNRFVKEYKKGMFLEDGTILEPIDIDMSDARTTHKSRPKVNQVSEVNCYTKEEGIIYINALGEVFPCCHLGFLDGGNPTYDTLDWLDRKSISLYHKEPAEIFNWFEEVERRWNTEECLPTCERVCGKKAYPHLFKDIEI